MIKTKKQLLKNYIDLKKEESDRFNEKMQPFLNKLKITNKSILNSYDEFERYFLISYLFHLLFIVINAKRSSLKGIEI